MSNFDAVYHSISQPSHQIDNPLIEQNSFNFSTNTHQSSINDMNKSQAILSSGIYFEIHPVVESKIDLRSQEINIYPKEFKSVFGQSYDYGASTKTEKESTSLGIEN